MKRLIWGIICLGYILLQSCGKNIDNKKRTPDFRNFYGIVWNETAHHNLLYAKQMGYDYVFYQKGMENDSLSDGFYFYLESPEYSVYSRYIDPKNHYSQDDINFYETNCVLRNTNKAFPENLAWGWFLNERTFTAHLDYQQQRVISWAVDSILKRISLIESGNPNFKFGGFAWDCPRPSGDFWTGGKPYGQQSTLKYWTGGDYGLLKKDATHDYKTFSEGRLAYFKQLIESARKKYPGMKVIMEPETIYEDWISQLTDCSFLKDISPDLLAQEKFGTEFVDDERIFLSGLISKNNIASTTSDRFSEADNRLIAAKAAINGAWLSWYGQFGGMGDMPYFRNIVEVPSRLKLIRMLPNWENLNGTPLAKRMWDGTTYSSPTAFVSPNAIAIVQPFTNKQFIVFLSEKGEIIIPKGKEIAAIFKADPLFLENGDGSSDIVVQKNKLKPRIAGDLNIGYIVHLQ